MNKKIFSNTSKLLTVILLTAGFLFFNSQNSFADKEKDLILILDTSLSMVGFGGDNILPQVKKSLPVYIEQLEEDDSITFITFDTEVKVYPTVYIDDEKNKESLIGYIKNIEATGKWTYTKQMIQVAMNKAQELEEKDDDRQQVIVVMTDALDDPPPDSRKDRLNIKEIAENYKNKDWFIFFINFGQAEKNEKLAKIQEELKTSVTEYTEVIEAKETKTATIEKNIAKTIEQDLSTNIEEMTTKKIEREGAFPVIPLLMAILIIIALLLILYYFKTYTKVKVHGQLEYWDHTVLSPYFEKYNLTRQDVKEILVGKKGSCNLTIREIEINDPFRITATRVNGEIKNTLQPGKGYHIEYINREPGGYLKNGDMFKVANYTFKYTNA
ncbi:MAG: VWA domain-containing protein [Spirochaetes bacterium]|nr:VWA domain-containing protein [Spirochaetota bacterium]